MCGRAFERKKNMTKIDELVAMTQRMKQFFKDAELVPVDSSAPASVREHGAFTWKEDCFYHTLLGDLPEPGIWKVGRTKEESWQLFDKEYKTRVQRDGSLRELTLEEQQALVTPDFDMAAFLQNCQERFQNIEDKNAEHK